MNITINVEGRHGQMIIDKRRGRREFQARESTRFPPSLFIYLWRKTNRVVIFGKALLPLLSIYEIFGMAHIGMICGCYFPVPFFCWSIIRKTGGPLLSSFLLFRYFMKTLRRKNYASSSFSLFLRRFGRIVF